MEGFLRSTDSDPWELLHQRLTDVAVILDPVLMFLPLLDLGVGKAVTVLLLNSFLDLGLDLALSLPFGGVEGWEGIGGNEEGAGAHWAVLRAAHVSDLEGNSKIKM